MSGKTTQYTNYDYRKEASLKIMKKDGDWVRKTLKSHINNTINPNTLSQRLNDLSKTLEEKAKDAMIESREYQQLADLLRKVPASQAESQADFVLGMLR